MSSYSALPIFKPLVLAPDPNSWLQAENSGDTGGPSMVVPHGSYTLGEDENGNLRVGLSPVSAASSTPWDTFYFYNDVGFQTDVRLLSQEIGFNFPTAADFAACEAFEWEMEYAVNGDVWNCGWQVLPAADSNSVQVRIFNDTLQVWKALPTSVTVAAPFFGRMIRIVTEHTLTADHETHVAVWFDGKRFPVNVSQQVLRGRWPKGVNYLHTAFQFDCKQAGTPFTAIVASAGVTEK